MVLASFLFYFYFFKALKVHNDCLEHIELTDGQQRMVLCCRDDLSGHFDVYFPTVKA